MITVFTDFRIVDETGEVDGTLVLENDLILARLDHDDIEEAAQAIAAAGRIIDGDRLREALGLSGPPVLMPAFVDLHAHFREPGFPEKETLESASLAAVKGGYTTLVCMANTRPPLDTIAAVESLKDRSDALGLIDLYPAISLSKGMLGAAPSEITRLVDPGLSAHIRLASEDGKDLACDDLFIHALEAAAAAGIPVSCHCDLGGETAAVERVLRLACKTSMQPPVHLHIAHVSTKETVDLIRRAKSGALFSEWGEEAGFRITAEGTPHHLCLSTARAAELGETTHGKVAPPLGTDDDRAALRDGLTDGTIDAIATDHAPHTAADKADGAPGFSGLETAFQAVYTALIESGESDLSHVSRLMSANPARILGFSDRGLIEPGYQADLVIINSEKKTIIDQKTFRSRGKNTPFDGLPLSGDVLMTIFGGKTVYEL